MVDRAALARWQSRQLAEVVAWAREHSPFYRGLYARLPSDEPRGLPDLRGLPFVTPDDVRRRGIDLVCVPLGDIARVVTLPTSGSTGQPKRLWFTEPDLELTADHFRHGMRALVEPGDRVLVLMPGPAPGSVGALLRVALARDGVEVQAYGFVDDCGRVARRILEFGADCLVGVPGQVLWLARSREGREIPAGRVKSVLLSGDHVAEPVRAAIEQAWGCRVFEHYGSTETGLGGAVQCRAFAGLHIREADLLFEVVDPDTLEPLLPGHWGELVVTTLTRRGMPLIRYRTGDRGRLLKGRCACGSVLRCLDRVRGRMADEVDLGGRGRLTMADLDGIVYAQEWVRTFSAEVADALPAGSSRPAACGELVLRVTAWGEPSRSGVDELRAGVEAVPAVAASDTGVRIEVVAGEETAAPGKRRIRDTRSWG